MKIKSIVKKFDFLKSMGYNTQKMEKNGDLELTFVKDDVKIEIIYYLSISQKYAFDLIITLNGIRKNLLNCEFFDEKKMSVLRKSINEHASSCTSQVQDYADFIKANVNSIENWKYI